jgi:hypothetical protein
MLKLIKNQTIRIDSHHRGDGVPLNLDNDDVHIHKIINRSRDEYEFKIPLNPSRPLCKGGFETMPIKIKKEIKEAFRDETKRSNFCYTLYDVLSNYSSIYSNEEKAFDALKRVCECFGLMNETIKQFDPKTNTTKLEFNKNARIFFAKMSVPGIEVGQKE